MYLLKLIAFAFAMTDGGMSMTEATCWCSRVRDSAAVDVLFIALGGRSERNGRNDRAEVLGLLKLLALDAALYGVGAPPPPPAQSSGVTLAVPSGRWPGKAETHSLVARVLRVRAQPIAERLRRHWSSSPLATELSHRVRCFISLSAVAINLQALVRDRLGP